MGSESDKRDTERVLILGDLQGEIMVFEPLQIKEISRGGASVETRFPLALNSLHELRLTLGAQSVVLKGRVAHSRISDVDQEIVTYRTGIAGTIASNPIQDSENRRRVGHHVDFATNACVVAAGGHGGRVDAEIEQRSRHPAISLEDEMRVDAAPPRPVEGRHECAVEED